MITSIDTAKAFDKIKQPFMKKKKKIGTEGKFLNTIKGIYEKPTANTIFKKWEAGRLFPKIRNKAKMLALTATIWHYIENASESF